MSYPDKDYGRELEHENARLRESMAAYDRLLREAEAERDRLREDRDLGKRMFDDLELQAQDYEAERDRLREGRQQALVAHAVEKQAKHNLEAENARLREELAARPKVYFPQEDVSKLLAERDKLREENKQLRRAYESDAEAIEQAAENARLRENQCLICEYPADHDQQLCVTELARLREENDRLREKLAEAVARLEDADHHWREIHGVHTHEAML